MQVTLTSTDDVARLRERMQAKQKKYETFVTVRVIHDERFNTVEGKVQLANTIGQRAYTIDGVRDAQASPSLPLA